MIIRKKIKKIHILSIMALTEDSFPVVQNSFAVINCAEHPNRHLSNCSPELLLSLDFMDTTSEKDPRGFSEENGDSIRQFVEALPDTVTDLYIFCDAGESRSAAVAAGIILAMGCNDDVVWENPYYHPNVLVFQRLCQSFEIMMTKNQIQKRQKKSEDAFKDAINNGSSYQRWEVIYLK